MNIMYRIDQNMGLTANERLNIFKMVVFDTASVIITGSQMF